MNWKQIWWMAPISLIGVASFLHSNQVNINMFEGMEK